MCHIHSLYPTSYYAEVLEKSAAKTIDACLYVYLLRCAEDVSVILAEPSNTSETSQCSGELITMQCPEVSPSQRKLLP